MTDRQLKILGAVVDEYIKLGEPVGSKFIAQSLGNIYSSATIRNEMAVLESLELLEHPHTSAGRVPTFKGYHIYIERLMKPKPLSNEEKNMIDSMLDTSNFADEAILQNAVGALSEITKCVAVVSDFSPHFSVISNIEVIPTGKRMYIMLLITSNGSVKNRVCRLQFDLTNEQIDFFKKFMLENLQGISLETLSSETFEELAVTMGSYMLSLSPLLYTVFEMTNEMTARDVSFAGQANLIRRSDVNTGEIVQFFENKKEIAKLLNDSFSGIHVMFGNEADHFVVTNSSIITANYKKSDKTAGALGIIGPMRLDYSKIIPYVEYFTQKVTGMLSDETDKGDDIDEERR